MLLWKHVTLRKLQRTRNWLQTFDVDTHRTPERNSIQNNVPGMSEIELILGRGNKKRFSLARNSKLQLASITRDVTPKKLAQSRAADDEFDFRVLVGESLRVATLTARYKSFRVRELRRRHGERGMPDV